MTERLKKHGKWIFVLLAVIFAMSFVFGSVGSSGGLSFLDYFSNRQQQQDVPSTETVASDLESLAAARAATKANPKDAKAWTDLGTALSARASTEDATAAEVTLAQAASALAQAAVLAPDDDEAQQRLADAYAAQTQQFSAQAQTYYNRASLIGQQLSASGTIVPGGAANADVFNRAADALVSKRVQEQYDLAAPFAEKSSESSKKALVIVEKLAMKNKTDPKAWFEYAVAADQAGETDKATEAYRKFIVLAPGDPLVKDIEARLLVLNPPPSSASVTGTAASTSTAASTTP